VSKPVNPVDLAMDAGEVALQAESMAAPAAEGSLIALCLRGDGPAFGRLVSLHEGMVFNLALRLLGDREEARDLAQDVFLKVYRALASFQGRSSLRTWIYRITVNLCRNRARWWRRRRRDRWCRLEDLSVAEEARLSSGRPGAENPFERVERRDHARLVQAALLDVSFDHRTVLILREVEGLSCEEIGAALGVAEGTVKSRLARGREALRRSLERRAGPGGGA
jgi:RNA polymerase sigma-70 factor, ECF subfamily